MANIAIFGGSFNPVHCGHYKIVLSLIKTDTYSKIIIVPAWQNPLKKEIPALDDQIRLAMLRATFSDLPSVEISDYEIQRKEISYTYKTIEFFRRQYPGDNLFLILGEDSYNTLPEWINIEKIIDQTRFVVFSRKEQASVSCNVVNRYPFKERSEYRPERIPDISATQLRTTDFETIEKNQWMRPEALKIWKQHYNTKIQQNMELDSSLSQIIEQLLDAKALNVVQYDMAGTSSVTDYVIICHATSTAHARGICDKTQLALKSQGVFPLGIEGAEEGLWILMDYNSVIVHVFLDSVREHYAIDEIFNECQKESFDA